MVLDEDVRGTPGVPRFPGDALHARAPPLVYQKARDASEAHNNE